MAFFDNKPNLWTHDCSSKATCVYQIEDFCPISGLMKNRNVCNIQGKIQFSMNMIKSLANFQCNGKTVQESAKPLPVEEVVTDTTTTALILDVIEEEKKKPPVYESVSNFWEMLVENKWTIGRHYCKWGGQTCTNKTCIYAHSFSQFSVTFSKQKVIDFFKNASIKPDNQEKPLFFITRQLVDDFKCTTKGCKGEMNKDTAYLRYYNNINNLLRYPEYVSHCTKCSKKLVLSMYM
jgi:hypothetical protein